MIRLASRCTRTDTYFPYTTLFGSVFKTRRECGVGNRLGERTPHRLNLRRRHRQNRRPQLGPAEDESKQGRLSRPRVKCRKPAAEYRSEEHTSELQSIMRNSYAVCFLKKN